MNLIRPLFAAALALAGTGSAHAVHLAPNGLGQALIYPYYTVNAQQQTLLSVSNTGYMAQALNVRFREGYNGRSVMDFRIFLSAGDTWTATVFNLRDAGIDTDGAAILTRDLSCTSPQFASAATTLADGTPYVAFTNAAYAGLSNDGGPQSIARTREGWFEIIALADLLPPLSHALTPAGATGAPANCDLVQNLVASPQTVVPSGDVMGAASIINVAQGTILATRAEVLAGFTGRQLLTNTAVMFEGLASVNDGAVGDTATARVFDASGRLHTLTYGNGFGRPIDAVSTVLMTDQISNEYTTQRGLAAGSDWVVTMPTKPHYTDPLLTGSATTALPPFLEVFGAPGRSRVFPNHRIMDREERSYDPLAGCGFIPPPGCFEAGIQLSYASAVIGFVDTPISPMVPMPESPVLQSTLAEAVRTVVAAEGWLELRGVLNRFPASAEGKALRGIPAIGFWATNLVNNAVSSGVLSNYATAVRHAATVTCIKVNDGSACD